MTVPMTIYIPTYIITRVMFICRNTVLTIIVHCISCYFIIINYYVPFSIVDNTLRKGIIKVDVI